MSKKQVDQTMLFCNGRCLQRYELSSLSFSWAAKTMHALGLPMATSYLRALSKVWGQLNLPELTS